MVGMNALQCLDTGFFVNADHMDTGVVQLLGLVIQFAYGSDLLPKSRFILDLMIQPIFDPMGF